MISQQSYEENHPLFNSWDCLRLMNDQEYRLTYVIYGKVGSLFDFDSGRPKNLQLMNSDHDEDCLYKVYDNLIGEWTNVYLKEIPFTRTYAPRPRNTLE